MLPAANRLRRHQDIVTTVSRGRRAARGAVLVHVLATDGSQVRVGFAVGRKVGHSVTRSQVTRQLRHQMRAVLPDLNPGQDIVVRALAGAGEAGSARLGQDLRRALAAVPGALR